MAVFVGDSWRPARNATTIFVRYTNAGRTVLYRAWPMYEKLREAQWVCVGIVQAPKHGHRPARPTTRKFFDELLDERGLYNYMRNQSLYWSLFSCSDQSRRIRTEYVHTCLAFVAAPFRGRNSCLGVSLSSIWGESRVHSGISGPQRSRGCRVSTHNQDTSSTSTGNVPCWFFV